MVIGQRLGPYEILAKFGEGGMGEVYRARDARLDRDVAIKVLPADVAPIPTGAPGSSARRSAVAALSHPNVLGVHDVGVAEGIAYVVMELLEGETLRSGSTAGALPVRKAVETAVEVARGLPPRMPEASSTAI